MQLCRKTVDDLQNELQEVQTVIGIERTVSIDVGIGTLLRIKVLDAEQELVQCDDIHDIHTAVHIHVAVLGDLDFACIGLRRRLILGLCGRCGRCCGCRCRSRSCGRG